MNTIKKDGTSNVAKIMILCVVTILAISIGFYVHDIISVNSAEKNITVTVNYSDEKADIINIKTHAKTLGQALKEENIAQGENGAYGLYIKTVKGVTADEKKEQWWCITKGGQNISAGADAINLQDKDKYELTLKTGY